MAGRPVRNRPAQATVTAFEGADGRLVPRLFVAVTVQVYVRFRLGAPNLIELMVLTFVCVTPPFDDVHVAVKCVIGTRLSVGAEKVTRSESDGPCARCTPVGEDGTPIVITGEPVEGAPRP